MRNLIDLSIPLYDYMPVGNVWAWDVPFTHEVITNIEQHGFELWRIIMHSETGTRLMIPAMSDHSLPHLDELELSDLYERPTAVIDIPKDAREPITAEDIDQYVGCAGLRTGDAVLNRTGWGNGQRYEKIGDDYARQTPYFGQTGAERLVDVMRENKSNLLLSDITYFGCGDAYMVPEWSSKPAWERPPFPSEQAKRYMHEYSNEKMLADFGSAAALTRSGFVLLVAALVDCDKITQQQVSTTVLPLKMRGGVSSPCRVIAVEES
jgi:kynurenine formamidase